MNAVVVASLVATSLFGWRLIDPLLGLSVAVLVANFAADMVYRRLDPRVTVAS